MKSRFGEVLHILTASTKENIKERSANKAKTKVEQRLRLSDRTKYSRNILAILTTFAQ